MNDLGLKNIGLFSCQHDYELLQRNVMGPSFTEVTDGLQDSQLAKQKEPLMRSPTSTFTDDGTIAKSDAATLAAAYRARIALAAASPAPTVAPSNQLRSTPAARLLTFVNSPLPTPTVHGNDQNTVQVLEKKWRMLYGGLKSNSQAAADVLMKQAQATSQLEELAQALFMQLKASTEDRARLQQQLLQERAQLMVQVEEAQQLQNRLNKSEHRSTAVQVVTESLQSQLVQARDALEVSNRERQQLAEQLAVANECRTRGDSLISEQTAVIETLRHQLEEQASTTSSLAEDKSQLEAQLQGVLRAEQELTVHLRETHAAIEGQLAALREQLKAERQKRAAVVKRRGELQTQVEQLQAQVTAQQADMAALTENVIRGGLSHLASSRATQVAATSHPSAPATLKPTSQAGAHLRPLSVGSAAHSRGTAAPSASSTVGAAQQRSRTTLRPGSMNPKTKSQSPTLSGGSSSTQASGLRRSSSPSAAAADDTYGQGNAPAVTFRVPSSLPSPEASFAMTSAPAITPGTVEQELPKNLNAGLATPIADASVHTTTVVRAATAIEPPSPPIAVMSAREDMGLHMEPGSAGLNRRRPTSPETSRGSINATQNCRRGASTAGRTAGARATSPSPAAVNTWLP